MKYKIVVDSSSDLKNDYIKDSNIGFEVVPLTIFAGGQDFVDDKNINVDEMLTAMHNSKTKSTTACPSSEYFKSTYEEAENIICITISSKISGTYNSAYLGSTDCNKKVHVVDSKATSGVMQLLVDKTYELMKQDLSFEEITTKIEEYKENLNLFFVLNTFENLVKNGRMSKLVAFVATALYIKPLCIAKDGTIEIYEKPRTIKNALNRLVDSISKKCTNFENRKCIISHCKNEESALFLKEEIQKKYPFKEIVINEMRGLCSFYALEKGVIVSF